MAHVFKRAKTLRTRQHWSGNVGQFVEDDLELPDGRLVRLAVLRHPGAAAIVPFVDADHVVLLRQYRHAVSDTLWEVPAGKLDPGETPETCARRELEEETGYTAANLHSLGHVLPTPGFTDEIIHLYAATNLTFGKQDLDNDEAIETEVVPYARAVEMARNGELSDGKSIVALFRAEPIRDLLISPLR